MYARFEQSNFIEKRSQTRSQFWNGRTRYMLLNTHSQSKVEWIFSSSGTTHRFSFLVVHRRRKKTEALLIDFFSASIFLCVQGKSLYEHLCKHNSTFESHRECLSIEAKQKAFKCNYFEHIMLNGIFIQWGINFQCVTFYMQPRELLD